MAELKNMSSNEKHLLTGNLYVIHEKTAFLQPLSMGCCRERILDWGAGNSGLSQLLPVPSCAMVAITAPLEPECSRLEYDKIKLHNL